MKHRCYPKSASLFLFLLALLLILFDIIVVFSAVGSMKTNLIFGCLFLTIPFFVALIALKYMQYFQIKDGQLVTKWLFGTINKLDLSKSVAYIETYIERGRTVTNYTWICLYETKALLQGMKRFEKRFSNRKSLPRIQILRTEENLKLISTYITVNSPASENTGT